MKRIVLFLSVMACTLGFSQENEVSTVKTEETATFKKNEIKINPFFLIIGAAEVTYERIINEESGVGLTLFASYDEANFNMKYNVTPYYRMYFGKKPAAGFFITGFAMYNQFDEDYCYNCDYYDSYDPNGNYYPTYYNSKEETSNNFALGIGVGAKWITKRGILFELSGGIGRNLYKSNDYAPDIVGNGGIIIGYRF